MTAAFPEGPGRADIPFPEILAAFRRDPLSLLGKIPGVVAVDKPEGLTSRRVVDIARKRMGVRRIGHAGTLDPLATGLLLLLAGNAARLFDEMQTFPKRYRAGFRLGIRTDSQDMTGAPVPGWRGRSLPLGREEVAAALASFRGPILQVPPMHSALKRNGVPLYRLARRGETVERSPRPVTAHSLELAGFDGETGELDMTVSSGFYVRTLIDDLGLRLGPGAAMTCLRRLAIGPFGLEHAVRLDSAP